MLAELAVRDAAAFAELAQAAKNALGSTSPGSTSPAPAG
jgi:hypothetical protein